MISGLVFLISVGSLSAQGPASGSEAAAVSDQQARGKMLYTEKCSMCHQENLLGTGEYPPLTGDAFWSNWETYNANNLLEQIRTTMPADNPGSLSRENYVDIVAYVLQMNDVTLTAELSTDAESLRKVILKKDAK